MRTPDGVSWLRRPRVCWGSPELPSCLSRHDQRSPRAPPLPQGSGDVLGAVGPARLVARWARLMSRPRTKRQCSIPRSHARLRRRPLSSGATLGRAAQTAGRSGWRPGGW